jgi:hypothetical protein
MVTDRAKLPFVQDAANAFNPAVVLIDVNGCQSQSKKGPDRGVKLVH